MQVIQLLKYRDENEYVVMGLERIKEVLVDMVKDQYDMLKKDGE